MINKRNCTESTIGNVIKLRSKGTSSPTVITVQYVVDGVTFEVRETVKKKNEWIKIGLIPIGQRRIPVMGATGIGSDVSVTYNPMNPAEAFITDNKGRWNI